MRVTMAVVRYMHLLCDLRKAYMILPLLRHDNHAMQQHLRHAPRT